MQPSKKLRKIGKYVVGGIAGLMLVGVAVLGLSGLLSYRPAGICYGNCDSERRRDFERLFDGWLSEELECIDGDQVLGLLAEIDPWLADRIEEKNDEFRILAEREKSGSLTVGERESYLSDPWRVPEPRLPAFSYLNVDPAREDGDEHIPRTIRSCTREGFQYATVHSGDPRGLPEGLCHAYVNVSFTNHLNAPGVVGWSTLKYRVYSRLRDNGEIESHFAEMHASLWRDHDIQAAADAELALLPASQVSSENIGRQAREIYIRMKCSD